VVGNKDVFVSGLFNVLHPGHVRLFQFARQCGTRLIVGIYSDLDAGEASFVEEQLRLEAVRSCSLVDEAFILRDGLYETLVERQPSVVVKGREHFGKANVEATAVSQYGGRLLFSSGELEITSRDRIRQEFSGKNSWHSALPREFMKRHGISASRLEELVTGFSSLKVLVVGDLIIDEYVTCDPLGMSQEDPTLVVKPIHTSTFVGGAGIVAAHAAGLGAAVTLLSVVGNDELGRESGARLSGLSVNPLLVVDDTRPTTLKTRFRCRGKTLLRVSRLHQSPIPVELQDQAIRELSGVGSDIDVVVFSDFNYGVLPQAFVERLVSKFQSPRTVLAADSQSSSQIGNVGRFVGMTLLTPTEREARISTRNFEDGLNILSQQLRSSSRAQHVLLTVGEDGVLVATADAAGQERSPDKIEALNDAPKDVAGAGDSMLIGASLSLAAGANIWEAACVGSMAAAIQVSRIGNTPVSTEELFRFFPRSNQIIQ
jgi:rfaE bifunctional protein kinase chain/domain